MTETPESITEAELAGVLAKLAGNSSSIVFMDQPGKVAADLVAEVLAHREPEYEPGEIYEDKTGGRFYRREDGWLILPEGQPFSDHVPNRPLRKLVPEGQYEQAAALVAEWRGLGEQDDAVPAWRGGYRAALRKCADELEYALKHGGSGD